MEKRQTLRLFWIEKGTATLGYLAGIAGLLALFLWRLSTLVPLLSREYVSLQDSNSLGKILDNPVNTPYKLMQRAVHYVFGQNILYHRMVSVMFALLLVGLFYYILRHWYSMRVAILGIIMLACSSWFLHLAREATPLIMQTAILSVIAYGIWTRHNKKPGLTMLIGCVLAGGLIYIPGFVWLVIVAVIWQRSLVAGFFKKAPITSTLSLFVLALLISPIIWSGSRNINLYYDISAIPIPSEVNYKDLLERGLGIPKQLFWRGYSDTSFWLLGTPMLDLFVAVMACLGLYTYIYKRSLDRVKIICGSGLLAVALIIVGGKTHITLMLPIIYLAAASGIAFMLQQWRTIFPVNPLARRLGTIAMIVAVAASCFYQLNHYFIAWPQSPQTKSGFHLRH